MLKRYRKIIYPLLALLFFFSQEWATETRAAVVTLPSGERLELSAEQVEGIKKAPGIYYLEYPTEKFIRGDLDQWIVIELPPDLGGGFVIGTARSMERALEAVSAGPPVDRPPAAPRTDAEDRMLRIKRAGFDAFIFADTGLRSDDLDWQVAGDSSGNNPNIRTEVDWDDVTTWQLATGFRGDIKRRFHVRADLAYGRVMDGTASQTDYAGDNRSGEFSRVAADAADGSTLDASFGVGYHFRFGAGRIGLTPLLGLAYNSQQFEMTDGVQEVSDFGFPVPEGPIADLDNSYDAAWTGPWIGLDLVFNPKQLPDDPLDLRTAVGIAYHWADYSADGSWNLNTDPGLGQPNRFEHEADGSGIDFTASLQWMFKKHWGLNAGFVYRNWETDKGSEKARFADGSSTTRRLNQVNWVSYVFSAGLTYRF